jgi:hypothetical protein
LDAEVKYSRHFDGEFRRRNCLGIEVMLDLHTNATEQCFVEARRRFDAQLFRESVPHLKELEQTLRDHDASLRMGVNLREPAQGLLMLTHASKRKESVVVVVPIKNPAAVALGKLGASKGGIARAESLSPRRKASIARAAALARWSKK